MEFHFGPPPATLSPLSPHRAAPAAHLSQSSVGGNRAHGRVPVAGRAPTSERFVRDRDCQRFIVSHAVLRMILGQYLGVSPGHVEMAIATNGKPRLVPAPNLLPLCFNLSHSEDWRGRVASTAQIGVARRALVSSRRRGEHRRPAFRSGGTALLAGAAGARAVARLFSRVGAQGSLSQSPGRGPLRGA